MGEVYLAEHKYIARERGDQVPAARPVSNSSELVGRFFAEARAASVIKHPGIVEMLDCDVHDGRAYIVMELLARGEPARLRRARRQRRPRRAGRAGGSPADRVGAGRRARAAGSSTAISSPTTSSCTSPTRSPAEPHVKVLDFGIAKLHGPRRRAAPRPAPGSCWARRCTCRRSSAAARGRSTAAATSTRSAASCSRSSAGDAPFLDEGFGDLIIAHVSRPPPEPLHAAPWMSAPARRLLLDCLAKDPADRPQSMRDVVASLSQLHPSEEIALQVPVLVEPRPRAGAATDGRTSGSRSGQRLMQTTPMPASAGISSAARR